MQNWLKNLFVEWTQNNGLNVKSLTVNLTDRTQVARKPRSDTINENFAFRVHSHGGPHDLPKTVSVPPADFPVLSPVYMSQSTSTLSVALTVPIRHKAGNMIDRLGMSMDVEELGSFQELGQNEVLILVGARDYEVADTTSISMIADHPMLSSYTSRNGAIPHVRSESLDEDLKLIRSTQWLTNFQDPIDGYTGEAVAVPVLIPGRASSVNRCGWIMVLHPAVK